MMQTHESRLLKAAKRTIRAEVTLVIIIIVISSWSIYALYKFTTGSDSFFGMAFIRPAASNRQQSDGQKGINDTSNNNLNNQMMSPPYINLINPHQLTTLNYSQQNDNIKQKQLLQQLIAGQQELYANLGPPIHNASPAHQLRPYSINSNTNSFSSNGDEDDEHESFRLVPGYGQSLPMQQQQQQQQPLEAHDRSSSEPEDDNTDEEHQASRGQSRLNFPTGLRTNKQPEPPPPPPVSADQVDHKADEDREAAESSRETGESVVDAGGASNGGGESDATGEHQSSDENPASSPSSSSSAGGDSEEGGADQGGESGGSEEPPSESQEASTPAADNQQEEQDTTQTATTPPPSGGGESSPEMDQNGTESDSANSNNDAGSDEPPSTQETSQSIDDEVDRMTQPSSGSSVFHQQERPFDYKNTVQFDDSIPASSAGYSDGGGGRTLARSIKAVSPGSQVARFEAPHRKGGMGKPTLSVRRVHGGGGDDDDDDLQVDHNSLIVRNDNGTNKTTGTTMGAQSKGGRGNSAGKDKERRIKKVITRNGEKLASRGINHTKATESHNYPTDDDDIMELDNNNKLIRSQNHRQKRDSTATHSIRPRTPTKIGAPYEIEEFLNRLDFDSLVGLSSSPSPLASDRIVRQPRKLSSGDAGAESSRGNKTNGDSSLAQPDIRRFGDDDNYGIIDSNGQLELPQENLLLGEPSFTQIYGLTNGSHPMPSYLTTNNTDLRELLNQRRLLDALKYSQLPSPQQPQLPYKINNQNSSSDTPIEDTKTAGTLYHVDHSGLMLIPSADERHSHKSKEASMSKKKKKHKKSKEKKKTTVAFKKGGHKKKKHKKEEKKYLKEKKFKGAKKGKKVSKGKGGAGGKKGKKLYKDKGYKKKGFKKVYHKEEWGNKKSFFDEFRDKDFKKKWKKFDDKYNYAHMKKYQAKDEKGAKKMKHHDEIHKKYDKGKWKKSFHKKSKEHKESSKKEKKKKSKGHH